MDSSAPAPIGLPVPIWARDLPRKCLIALYVGGMLLLMGFLVDLHRRECGDYWDISPFMLVTTLTSATAYATLGSLLILYRPDNRIGQLCCLCGIASISAILTSMALPCGLESPSPSWFIPYLAWFAYTLLPFLGVLPQFVLLPLLFPTGKFLSPRWAWVTGMGIAAAVVTSLALGLLPDFRQLNGVTWSLDLDNPWGMTGLPAWWHPVFMPATVILLTALCFLGMAAVAVRFRRARGEERQQMKWLAYFLSTVVAVQLLGFEVPGNLFYPQIFYTIWYDLIIFGVMVGFPLTVAIAVFKYGLYQIDLIIQRTLVYGTLTAGVILLYVVVVSTLGRLLHDEGNLVASLAAAGVVAVGFQPARLWLQNHVSRRLFGDRDNPAEVLTRLTNQLESADSGASLLSSLVTTIASSLRLPYAGVWIQSRTGEMELAAATGQPPATLETIPLLHQQEVIGRLEIAPRAPGEVLDATDRQLLVAIARLVATTARTIQLTDQVQDARVRTVSAREEERRRLRRDLHDGLGPVLAGQSLKLAAARQLLQSSPVLAESLIDEVMLESENTIAEVRRLVYALRPPTLDELGLVEAIREQIDSIRATVPLHIELHAPADLPEIPAALEVAVFRIVQEGLSNVIRHAQARRCTVTICIDATYIDASCMNANGINGHSGPTSLRVGICDDGIGLAEQTRRGVGLLSMQERAAEVGGLCRIENGAQGGVHIWLSVPMTP